MKFSFIIPLFNCLRLTQAMLQSLRATLPADLVHEIILIDDGSTDGTREWLGSLGEAAFRLILNPRNLGYAASNNRAAREASGDTLVLLNNDLLLAPGWLEPMRELLAGDSRIGIVGNVQRSIATGAIDHRGIFINAKAKPEHDRREPGFFSRSETAAAVTGACLMISRARWEQLGGFDEGYVNGCEDVDLCLRAREAGALTGVALRSVIGHHVSSSTGRKRNDEANTRRLFLRWRPVLARLGARSWCREYTARDLTAASAFARPVTSGRIFAYAAGWTRQPPDPALAGIQLAIDRELERWDQLLGS